MYTSGLADVLFSDFPILADLGCGKVLSGWIYAGSMVYTSFCFIALAKLEKRELLSPYFQLFIRIILEFFSYFVGKGLTKNFESSMGDALKGQGKGETSALGPF